MVTMRLGLRTKQRRLEALAADINDFSSDVAPATITLYTGAQPATVEDPITDQVAVAVIECPHPLEDNITNAVLTGATFGDAMGEQEGLAEWARLRDGTGHGVSDLTVGLTDSPNNITLNQNLIYAGALVRVTSLLIAEA